MACDPNVTYLSEMPCKQIVKIKCCANWKQDFKYWLLSCSKPATVLYFFGVNFNVISDISPRPRVANKLCCIVAQNS